MIKLLLADDNKLSLQYFSSLLCWEDYGFTLVASSVDGEDAWYDFLQYTPEVLIVDIQMPVLSGIDLAKRVLKSAPNTVIVFLSSFKEFQYAQEAIHLKVYDYLLKHETTKETLGRKLKEIRTYLTHEKRKRSLLAREEMGALFLGDCLREEYQKEAFPVLTNVYDCFLIELEHLFPFENDSGYEKALHNKREKKCLDDVVRFCASLDEAEGAISVSKYRLLLITTPNRNPFDFCCDLQRILIEHFSCQFSFVIVACDTSLQDCVDRWQAVFPCADKLYFYPSCSVLEGTYLLPNESGTRQTCLTVPRDAAIQYEGFSFFQDELGILLKEKKFSSFCEMANQWLGILREYDCCRICPKTGAILRLFDEEEEFPVCEAAAVYRWLCVKSDRLTNILTQCAVKRYSPVVCEAIRLISRYYNSSSLTVDWIAEQVKLSSSGLNIQFKKETGYTPSRVCHFSLSTLSKKMLKIQPSGCIFLLSVL